ncbi:D-Ala-D-Ala carboxypeptidase family metallohydrolase [Aliikangiella marina]|nr:D-Ala-D-Ala carboxypeptidase family metallohydrolase [Aliikangiella marina]
MQLSEKLSPHFTLRELIRSDTAARKGIDNSPPPELVPKLKRLCVEVLEPIRTHYNVPFSPNSGYRSKALNDAIGGSARSQHCLAEAVDIEVIGISNYELANWIRRNLAFDQLILECYQPGDPASGWVHVSIKDNDQAYRGKVLTYSDKKYHDGLIA